MTLIVLAYLAGVLTIVSPCILPVLPFVLARAGQPFRRNGLPMLVGMAITFATVASLAAVAGSWATELNHHARMTALVLIAFFGLALIFPALSTWLTTPLVSLGQRLSHVNSRRSDTNEAALGTSVLLGVATGLLWAPCAGPVLGLILAGAALGGPTLKTSLLLLAYASGAATALAAALLLSDRLIGGIKRKLHLGDRLRRALGAAVLASVTMIALGLDTGALTRISWAGTYGTEQRLIEFLRPVVGGEPDGTFTSIRMGRAPPAAPLFGTAPWINSSPLTKEDVKGRVVLLNFWTYSCINCLRALPYVRSWAEKYRDQGLVVIGVHTPEFAFEKNVDNVRKAATLLGVHYPIVIDNDFAIWRAFGNQAWPALYVIDAKGQVRHRVLGEGAYDQSERLIQQFLSEATGAPVVDSITTITGEGSQAAADGASLRSAETYLGYAQGHDFTSPSGIRQDVPTLYQSVEVPLLGRWSLGGVWSVGSEFATLHDVSGSITYRFHARDLHLVLAPPSQGQPIRFRIKLDGAAPGADHGTDVDAEGWGNVREARLYQLVRQKELIEDRVFEIEFLDPGVRAYAFTFG
ncbi:cytochrome c biogenesis protein DipZ [Geminicoccus roseus]|uniref:cytochrome c biogenesis protein DipZ n=1 Tax=Geminicoccus roseus TaxID=404900 RepID=UPI000427A31A|nr:cytochrome c biogenesis protein DipZ [Geminicoccus roseus]